MNILYQNVLIFQCLLCNEIEYFILLSTNLLSGKSMSSQLDQFPYIPMEILHFHIGSVIQSQFKCTHVKIRAFINTQIIQYPAKDHAAGRVQHDHKIPKFLTLGSDSSGQRAFARETN